MVRHVATRRHFNVVLFSCIILIAFVSQVSTLNLQWIGQNSCFSRIVHYVHTYIQDNRTHNHGGGLQCHSPLFVYFYDLHFLFVWAASIPERRTRTQCLSLSSSSSVLKSAASNPAVSGCFSPFQASSLASACGYWPLAIAEVNCLLVYHCFSPNYLS